MPRRAENWPMLLSRLIEERRHMPFAWGTNDCATFAGRAVEVIRGVPVTIFSQSHRGEKGAARALADRGVRSLEGLATKVLGDPQEPQWAGRGDIGLVVTPNGPTLAVVTGNFAVAPGADGLVFWPRSALSKAWKV